MRDTSIEAWRYIMESGVLSKRRTEAYLLLYQHGPCTAGELGDRSIHDGMWKRLSELQRAGVAKECGKRPCKITRRNAIVWDVTSAKPTKLQKGGNQHGHRHNPLTCEGCADLVDRAWQTKVEAEQRSLF